MSLPSHLPTSQPNARSFASRSPWSETSATHVSDWILLWSTIAVISPKPSFAACVSDSQNCPSWSSPSPVSTHTRRRSPRNLAARANPFAFEIPIPSEPVLVLTSGVAAMSGCPGSPPSRRSPWSFSNGSRSVPIRTE
jgi:hypothetical protein